MPKSHTLVEAVSSAVTWKRENAIHDVLYNKHVQQVCADADATDLVAGEITPTNLLGIVILGFIPILGSLAYRMSTTYFGRPKFCAGGAMNTPDSGSPMGSP